MPTQTVAAINAFRHDNHTPPAVVTQRSLPGSWSNHILIQNTSVTDIKVSFDGVNLLTIKAGAVFSCNFYNLKSYWTKGDGVAAVEVLLGSEL